MQDSRDYIKVSEGLTQIRLGIIGFPGTGKTTGALTFPNPIVIDYDRKCPPGVRTIPFWDPKLEAKFGGPRHGLREFLKTEGPKFGPEETLILDSWTMVVNQFEKFLEDNPHLYLTKKNEVDGFKMGSDRLSFAYEIIHMIKALSCNVIIIMHEQIERDDRGQITGRVKPLMRGQFADQMAAHLTDFFRAVILVDNQKKPQYLWQLVPDNVFAPITSFIPRSPYIPQKYEEYLKQKNFAPSIQQGANSQKP